MFQVLSESEKPLAEQVANQIVQLIIDQNLVSGQKLPNEFEIAQSLKVGRGTVREAVKLLVSRNVLEIQRGKGTFVAQRPGISGDPLGFAFIKDKYKLVFDLTQIRLMLEPQIAALAAKNAREEEIERMRELCEEIMKSASQNEAYYDLDVELHTCIAKSTGNLVMPNMIPIIGNAISLFNTFPRNYEKLDAVHIHREIIEAIAAHDEDWAMNAMHRHLLFNKRSLESIEAEYKV